MRIFSVLLVIQAAIHASAVVNYHIVPVNNTASCDYYPNGTCFTLSQLSSVGYNNSSRNITISFLPGEHLLNWTMTFINVQVYDEFNVTLNKEPLSNNFSDYVKISCMSRNAGIVTSSIHNFVLDGLIIYGCKRKTSHGGAISITKGNVLIIDTEFINNKVISEDDTGSGGALFLQSAANVVILNSTFTNNTVSRSNSSSNPTTACQFKRYSAFGGGAIGLYASYVSIDSCVFESNSAHCGGALLVNSLGSTANIRNTTLKGNHAHHAGGAIYNYNTRVPTSIVNTSFIDNSAKNGGAIFTLTQLDSTNNVYEKNTAQHGGVIYVSIHSQPSTMVSFFNTTKFHANTAEFGGAIKSVSGVIMFQPYSIATFKENNASYGGAIFLEQSTLISKKLEIRQNNAKNSGGGIYAFASLVQILDCYCHDDYICISHIGENQARNGGGIYLTASTLELLQSFLTVENNFAHDHGGGIYLEESSKINSYTINLGVTFYFILNFTNNTASRGGAVYVADNTNEVICQGIHSPTSSESNLSSKQCFFQIILSLPQTHYFLGITFANNSATETGSDIYGGLLDRCTISTLAQTIGEHEIDGITYLKETAGFDWATQKDNVKNVPCLENVTYGVVTNTSEFHDHISSDPVRVCFCVNNTPNCNYTYPTIDRKKGEKFTVSVVILDQAGKPVNATLFSSLQLLNRGIGRLKEGQQRRDIQSHCTTLEYNVFSYERSATLELYTDGPCGNIGISMKQINVTFLKCMCPIGLDDLYRNFQCLCGCAKELNSFISNCSPEKETIQIDSNVWIEKINSTNMNQTYTNSCSYIVHDCPFDYCIPKPVNISLVNVDTQCNFNRTGRLCGKCPQGLSLVFASSKCEKCTNYFIFLLIPFALAGIALIGFILLLDITVAKGTIHGLIFYANLLAANRSIFLPFDVPNFLTVFVSWLNLDVGIETCFYDGMSSYHKLLLQIVFPLYLFLLMVVIMVSCNYSRKIAHVMSKRNTEAALYTLTLLCYSKLIRIIITALQYAVINCSEGDGIFWLYDANVPYFSTDHIPRFLVACFIITLGVLYTTLLLFGQLFNICSKYRGMNCTTNIHYIHFLKAHHAPLSDMHRYWVGLLLLARLVHYLISAFANDSIIILSVSTMTVLLIFHKLVSKQIYTNKCVDLLETLFIVNLLIFAISTFFIRDSSLSVDNQKVLATVSISISFVLFLGIVLYHIISVCKNFKSITRKLTTVAQKCLRYRHFSARGYENISDNNDSANDTPSLASPPTLALPAHQLREPALDDLSPVRPEDYVTENAMPTVPKVQNKIKPTYSEVIV